MKINLNTTTLPSNKNYNNGKIADAKYKTNLIETPILFKGYESRVQAKKKSGVLSGMSWWWSGEEAAKEQVEKEMRDEINSLKKSVAVHEVTLTGLKNTLRALRSSHTSIQGAKESEISALTDTKKNNNSTIRSLETTITTKNTIIREQEDTNQKLTEILTEQNLLTERTTRKNKIVQKQRDREKRKSELKLEKDLETQRLQMQARHDADMDKLADSINASARALDPIKRMTNVQKVDGFRMIAGYNEQKNCIIQHFGTPTALEKYKKSANVPNGILLFGPSNCGKSTFVNAIAGQFECQLVEIPNAFKDKENMKNLRIAASKSKELFEKSGIRTIIHIGNFDEFAPKGSRITGALKGFMDTVSKDFHCTVFATTSFPEKIDDILLRDGRFKAKIDIPPANKENVIELLKHYASNFIDRFIDYDKLAEKIITLQGDKTLSNAQIKAAVQTLNQEVIIQNIANMASDIGKEALDLFKRQIEQVKRL